MARFVQVRNLTRQTVVADRCRVAEGPVQRIFGLHLVSELQAGEGLLLPGANSIDTTFMRYAMDAVFVDGSRRVTKVVHDMKPWRIVPFARGARDCIELPAGAARRSGTQVGDQLGVEDVDEDAPAAARGR